MLISNICAENGVIFSQNDQETGKYKMNRLKTRLITLIQCKIVLMVAIAGISQAMAQHKQPQDQELFNMIAQQDSLLFAAFNARDLEGLTSFFDETLEVYQDNTGLRNFEQTSEAFAGLFSQDYVLTRNLVEGSLEVFPVKDFGAIETGSHTFCHMENGKPDCGTFRFVHIWKQKEGKWKITRIITYDH